MKKTVKERVKAKAKAVKEKLKGKAKIKASVAIMAAILSLVLYEACSTATPASRATTASYEINVKVSMDEGVKSATVNVPFTFGDGALASADSSGSTETQTATPTVDVKPDVDVHYNDAIAGASAASRGVLETLLASSAKKVLELMESKETGTVEVQKTDGSSATVKCENGQCSFCEDCTISK